MDGAHFTLAFLNPPEIHIRNQVWQDTDLPTASILFRPQARECMAIANLPPQRG
jgi:hypothetical protein